MTFRILNSPKTWLKVRKVLVENGFDVDGLPNWTELSDKVRGVRMYRGQMEGVRRMWDFLAGIERQKQGTSLAQREDDDLTGSELPV